MPRQVTSPQIHVLPGYTLHAEELLEVDIAQNAHSWVAVLGKAWPLSTGIVPISAPSVAHELLSCLSSESGTSRIEDALYDMGGRYAVIAYSERRITVYNDACGNRSVYYSKTTGEVASHFALVRGGLEDRALTEAVGEDHREDLSWERTRSAYIETLVPNHRLHLPAGTQERFFPLETNRASSLNSDNRISLILRLWDEQLNRILESRHPKALSITAGLDSRTLLALAQPHADQFVTFTYTSDEAVEGLEPSTYWSRSGQNDYHGVEALRPFLPYSFRYLSIPVDRDSDPAGKWIEDNKNILGRNAERSHNRRLLPRYMDLFPDPRTIHYRGNLLEIGRLHFRKVEGGREEAFNTLISKLARAAHLDVDGALEDARIGAHRLGYDDIPIDYDLTDMFYWEQRHGRWFAQVLNETDVAFDTVTPFNVRRIIDNFLAYSKGDRADGFVQNELIYRASPLLSFFGVNGEPDLYRKFVSNGKPRKQDPEQLQAAKHYGERNSNPPVGKPHASSAPVVDKKPNTKIPVPNSSGWNRHYQAPIVRHASLNSIDFSSTTTAVHEVDLDDGRRIDFYAQLDSSETLFVSLHGAVPLEAPRYPHFRRVESMRSRVSALLCIADPTLALSTNDDFRLAWYTGNADWDPLLVIADAVRKAQDHVGAKRVMFLGGSGGGHASLRIAPLFPGSMAFVQDPQTDVARYYQPHLDRLFAAAWPGWDQQSIFEQHSDRFDLLSIYQRLSAEVFIYYRQSNGDEWHKTNHAKPFEAAVAGTEGFRSGRYRFVYEDSEKEGHGKISPSEFNRNFDAAMAFWDGYLA